MTLPVWLIVGFLGAGKTTVLRRLVHAAQGRRLIYVVNEFSAVDVDAGLIEREGGTAIAVPGGSIFCRCRIPDFVDVLRRVAEGIPAANGDVFQPEGVVVEASGIADPRSMRRLLAESGLDAQFHVAGVTAVVDPSTFMKLMLVLPNIRGQIEAADLILLNKNDLHAPETIKKIQKAIVAINPRATLIRCAHGAVDPLIVLANGYSARAAEVDAAFGLCRDPLYERETILFRTPVDCDSLVAAFDGENESLYRAKGFVRTNRGWRHFEWSAGKLTQEEVAPVAGASSALVLIWSSTTDCKTAGRLRQLA